MLYGSGELLNSGVNRTGSGSSSTAGATITWNLGAHQTQILSGTAPIAAPKTWALSNDFNAKFFYLMFNMATLDAQTFPADWEVNTNAGIWDGTTWTPDSVGNYMVIGVKDAINNIWKVRITGYYEA